MLHGHEVTDLLQQWQDGDKNAPDRLFPLVYDELRRRAAKYLSQERAEHTLQPTGLVHEAYVRLVGDMPLRSENRGHFFAIASRVMRQVLVDHARSHNARKRGGAAARMSIDSIEIGGEDALGDILQLNDALERLGSLDKRKLDVVEMRFFGGLKESEIAEILSINEKTVRRDWQFAKVWLYQQLANE